MVVDEAKASSLRNPVDQGATKKVRAPQVALIQRPENSHDELDIPTSRWHMSFAIYVYHNNIYVNHRNMYIYIYVNHSKRCTHFSTNQLSSESLFMKSIKFTSPQV